MLCQSTSSGYTGPRDLDMTSTRASPLLSSPPVGGDFRAVIDELVQRADDTNGEISRGSVTSEMVAHPGDERRTYEDAQKAG
jgi:hypothetical protein